MTTEAQMSQIGTKNPVTEANSTEADATTLAAFSALPSQSDRLGETVPARGFAGVPLKMRAAFHDGMRRRSRLGPTVANSTGARS